MAKNLNGVTGAFSGKIGTVVGAMWNGIPTLRSRPKYRDKPTQNQLVQRARFKLASNLCRHMARVIERTYEYEERKTKRSSAVGNVTRYAVTGEYPNFTIDYSKVLVAKGKLKKASEPVAISSGPGLIKFNWTHDPLSDYLNKNDRAIVIAYAAETENAIFNIDGESRFKGECQLEFPSWAGKEVHTWISFRSYDGLWRADSVYTGVVIIE